MAFGIQASSIASLLGATIYKGTWNATTNSPALASSTGTKGWYYVVSVAGATNLDGITDWVVGDWAIFNGTVWQKVDNTDGNLTGDVTSVGLVTTLSTSGVSAGSYTTANITVDAKGRITTASSGTASLFTDAGAYTYLTSTTDLFQVGSSSSLGASLGVKDQGATSGTTTLKLLNSADASLMYMKADGQFSIGIGSSSGEYRAVTIGTEAKTYDANGISIGYQAGAAQSSNGGNWLIGYQAGKLLSTGSTCTYGGQLTGSTGTINVGNTGFGYNVLFASTSDYNTAMGLSSMAAATTATTSTAYGQLSGYNVRAHSYGTYVGASASPSSTTAKNFQTCLGWAVQAGGAGSIAIGSGALSGGFYAINSIDNSAMFFMNSETPSFFVNKNSNLVLNTVTMPVAGTHFEAAATNAITIADGTASTVAIANSFVLNSVGGIPSIRTAADNVLTLDAIVSAAVAVASTNKIKITVNGTDYYLLATTTP